MWRHVRYGWLLWRPLPKLMISIHFALDISSFIKIQIFNQNILIIYWINIAMLSLKPRYKFKLMQAYTNRLEYYQSNLLRRGHSYFVFYNWYVCRKRGHPSFVFWNWVVPRSFRTILSLYSWLLIKRFFNIAVTGV
jgi:hypothetical protein